MNEELQQQLELAGEIITVMARLLESMSTYQIGRLSAEEIVMIATARAAKNLAEAKAKG